MDPDLVARKLARAVAWLNDVEQRVGAAAIEADNADLAAFHLQLALQECIDLAAHWVAGEGWTPPDHSAAAFATLASHGGIDAELATFMRAATGLRNRIAHGYADLDRPRLFAEARAGVPRIRRFLAACATAAGL